MKEVTQDMTISEILVLDKGIAPIMMSAGMHCLGCPSSQLESLKDACLVHGVNCDELIKSINDYLKSI